MKIKVKEERKVYCIHTAGTQNENKATSLEIEVPESYQEFDKKIVFITPDGTVWDTIQNNRYAIKKAITKYNRVKFYLWLTKGDQDFRSEEKELIFNPNTEPEENVTEEEISGLNKVFIKIEGIEKELEEANKKLETLEVGGYDDTEVKQGIQNLEQNKANKESVYTKQEIEEKINSGELKGEAGKDGKNGLTAYEIAVEKGFIGTETEWLASLKGADGKDGINGAKGEQGIQGVQGIPGEKGEKGDTGLQGIAGPKGDKGDAFTYNDFTEEQLEFLKGPKGDKGDKGEARRSSNLR